jgi:hypothetical protein
MKRTIAALALLLTATFAMPAEAGTTANSTIVQLKVLEESHPNHRLFHGALWLQYDKGKTNYRWGGKHCADKALSEIKVSMLFAAFRSKYSIAIDYREVSYKAKTYRCITGFTVRR